MYSQGLSTLVSETGYFVSGNKIAGFANKCGQAGLYADPVDADSQQMAWFSSVPSSVFCRWIQRQQEMVTMAAMCLHQHAVVLDLIRLLTRVLYSPTQSARTVPTMPRHPSAVNGVNRDASRG